LVKHAKNKRINYIISEKNDHQNHILQVKEKVHILRIREINHILQEPFPETRHMLLVQEKNHIRLVIDIQDIALEVLG